MDTLNGAKTVRELYEIGKSDAQKYTVPVWDRHLEGVGGQADRWTGGGDVMDRWNRSVNGKWEMGNNQN